MSSDDRIVYKRSWLWMVVVLVGAYILCQAVADVAATKLIQIGPVVMPAGTFIFALTFTLRDLIHKRLGKQWATATIVVAGALNLIQAGYFIAMAAIPAPGFYQLSDAWSAIFALVPSITIASIVAEVVSQLVDTEVYHIVWKQLGSKKQWLRVLISNAVSLPLDSFIFGILAFMWLPPIFGGGTHTFSEVVAIAGGQILFKAVVTIISMPAIYLVKD